jgi:zinc D-Ala-D-Ala carboxypeptidase
VFAKGTPPAREVLAESRPMKGSSGATDVATLGAAGVEVARDALAETPSSTLPLGLVLIRCAGCIALALVGIAVTIYARLDDWKREGR